MNAFRGPIASLGLTSRWRSRSRSIVAGGSSLTELLMLAFLIVALADVAEAELTVQTVALGFLKFFAVQAVSISTARFTVLVGNSSLKGVVG